MGGISNYQIKELLKKIGDEDLLENFVRVFPSNYMNKFINHAAMISDRGKYPFIVANTDASDKQVFTGGVYLTSSQEMTFFSLILSVLTD